MAFAARAVTDNPVSGGAAAQAFLEASRVARPAASTNVLVDPDGGRRIGKGYSHRMRGGARNRLVSAQPAAPEAKLKLALMACIDEGIRERYRTLQEAARVSKINRELLSRVRHGEHRRCSIASLLSIAERLQIHIKIDIQLVRTERWQ
jgi:hypothetical protein